VRCVPTSAKYIADNKGVGGGSEGRGAVTCPTDYFYLGKFCVTYTAESDEPLDNELAKSACSPDMLYFPKDQDQNIIFRTAMLEKVFIIMLQRILQNTMKNNIILINARFSRSTRTSRTTTRFGSA
jgi:hypothetical protein